MVNKTVVCFRLKNKGHSIIYPVIAFLMIISNLPTIAVAASSLTIHWTAPGDDGSSGTATQYDIRYSTVPIDESNWDSATQVSDEPTPGAPFTEQEKTLEGLPTGTRYYFALKTADEASNWSDLSNVPSLQDSGFRPIPDGYYFPNWQGSPGDYYKADVVTMFGEDVACLASFGGVCVLRLSALRFWAKTNMIMMLGGRCEGMAVTSARFFRGLDKPSDFQNGATTPYSLLRDNVRRHIGYYFAYQGTDPVAGYTVQMRIRPLSENVASLQSEFSGSNPGPAVLKISASRTQGHAVTPYAIEEWSSGKYRIWVYDNAYPDDSNRNVSVDTVKNEWTYGGWRGDATNPYSLAVVPISEYLKYPPCAPWDTNPCRWTGQRVTEIWLDPQGHLLVTDSQGRRIGFVGAQFINEIPGAYESIVYAGMDTAMEPLYRLPVTDTYTIALDGQTVTQTNVVSLTQFGPGYAASIEGVAVGPATYDTVVVSPDGTQLTYTASNVDQEVSLTLALDGQDVGYEFTVGSADVGAGEAVTLTALTDIGQLAFVNADTNGGVYDLSLHRVGIMGEQLFLHPDIPVSASDTHYVDYGNWSGDSLTIYIDHGSDGTVDETIELENAAPRSYFLYLPLVLKNH